MSNPKSPASHTQDGEIKLPRLWLPLSEWDYFGAGNDFLHTGSWLETPPPDGRKGPRPLDARQGSRVRVLLGRPGAGKSTELRSAAKKSGARLIEAREVYGGDIRRHLDDVLAGATGASLFLDGLDELLLENSHAIAQLSEWVQRHPASLQHLTIATRWADWRQEALEEMASKLDWPAPEVLVLCPLERQVAFDEARRVLGDARAEAFWQAVRDTHAEPVACWPQSYREMLAQFADDGTLGGSPTQLLTSTIRRRCRASEDRHDPRNDGLDPDWNFHLAGRLAATMIFTGRHELSLETVSSGRECLTPGDLGVCPESWNQTRVDVRAADLERLTRTQLLRQGSAEDCFVFEHQLYVECLAAHWLAAQQLSVPKLAALTGTDTADGWHCVPRFQPLAAWLARDHTDYRQWLLAHDPLTLLRLDAEGIPAADCEAVIEAILSRTAQIKTLDPAFRHAHLASLNHSRVEGQLERWLRDTSASDAAKELALEMAEAMKLTRLGDTLWEIWDTSSPHLRSDIARALLRLCRESHFDKWEAVLRGNGPELDPDGNLLGAALHIMVPERIPLREVLHWIMPERTFRMVGIYAGWAWGAAKHLRETEAGQEVPAILRHLGEHFSNHGPGNTTATKLAARVVPLAFQRLELPEILAALLDYWYGCRLRYASPLEFSEADVDDEGILIPETRREISDLSARQRLISALVADPRFERHRGHWFIEREDVPLCDGLLPWLLEQLLDAEESHRWRWAILVRAMIHDEAERAAAADLLDKATEASADLRKLLPEIHPGETVDAAIRRFDDEGRRRIAEQQAARNAEFEKKREVRRSEREAYAQSAREEHQKGGIVWHPVFQVLSARQRDDQDKRRESELATLSYIAEDEAWMRQAARRFLIEFPLRETFQEDDGYFGVMAVALLLDGITSDAELRHAIGTHWLSHLLYSFTFRGLLHDNAGQFLDWFPAELPAAYGVALRRCYPAGSCIQLSSILESHWHPGLSRVVEEMLLAEPLQPNGFCGAVRILSRHSDLPAARAVVRHWLALDEIKADRDQRAAVLAAGFFQLQGSIWPEIRPAIEADSALVGKMIATGSECRRYDSDRRDSNDFTDWPAEALVGFVQTLDKFCPGERWGRRETWGFHQVPPEDELREFRDQARGALRDRGQSVDLAGINPEQDMEDHASTQRANYYYRHSAARRQIEQGWTPFHPAEFLKAATRLDARLARTPAELMAAVVDSLRDYESALTREQRYKHLWDIKNPAPRDELDVAKDIEEWLDQKLSLAINREVQLQVNTRPDIVVQATWPDRQPVTVVIELKRDCHDQLESAMETQLKEKYLGDGWTHGLYLVAWMPPLHSRRTATAKLQAARARLEKQAVELSHDGLNLTAMVMDARHPQKDEAAGKSPKTKTVKMK